MDTEELIDFVDKAAEMQENKFISIDIKLAYLDIEIACRKLLAMIIEGI